MNLGQLSTREARTRPGRAVLTILSIVIGVAAVVSVAVSTTTTRQAHHEMYKAFSGKSALEVVTESSDAAFDLAALDAVQQVPGVQAVVPLVRKSTKMYFADKPIGVSVLGIDPERDHLVRQYDLLEGKLFDGKAGVVLSSDFARSLGAKLGDEVEFVDTRLRSKLQNDGEATMTPIVGILAPRGAAAFSSGGVFLHLETAQRMFKVRNKAHVGSILLEPQAEQATVQAAIAKLLKPGLLVRPPVSQPQMAEETLLATRQGLNTASVLSIVVAAFIMLNTFLMNVSERRRQISIMRAIGATRSQVLNLLVHEGFVMGLIGTVLGTLLGIGGAYLLTRAFEQLFQSTLPSLRITPMPILAGAAFGIGTALAATYFPARKASRISPLEGMARVAKEDLDPAPQWVLWLGLAGVIGSGVILWQCILGHLSLDYAIPAGVVAMLACMSVLPAVLEPVTSGLARLLFPILGIEGQLAQRQLVRRRMRTCLTISVLFLAVTTCIWLGNTILNNTNDVKTWFNRTVVGDFFVRVSMPDMSTGRTAEMPVELQDQLRAIAGVERVITVVIKRANVDSGPVNVISKDFSAGDQLALDVKIGDPEQVRTALLAGEAVIGTVLAQRTGLTQGDTLHLKTDEGPQSFRIAGVTNDYYAGGLSVYVDSRIAKDVLKHDGASAFILQVRPGTQAAVETELTTLCRNYGLLVQSLSSLRSVVDTMQNGVVGGLWVLLGLLLVVAAFGIANTLTMNVLEQTRELGLLRVVAMTRGQVRKTILSQAAIIGLVGLIPGVIIGSGAAYLVNLATQPEFGHPVDFALHPWLLVTCFVTAYIIVVATAWLPAERAARLELVTAMQYE